MRSAADDFEAQLERARQGDAKALNSIIETLLIDMRQWATRRLPARARVMMDTDDLVQETVLKTILKLDVFEATRPGGFRAYVQVSLLNRIRDEVRKASRHQSDRILDPPSDQPTPMEDVLLNEGRDLYEAALRRLKRPDREAVVARLEMKVSYDQAAILLGKPTSEAARQAIRRACERLLKEIARAEKGTEPGRQGHGS